MFDKVPRRDRLAMLPDANGSKGVAQFGGGFVPASKKFQQLVNGCGFFGHERDRYTNRKF